MTSTIQRSFAGGELAPALYARADLVKYATGLKTCRNFMVQRHGGVANRTGHEFIAECKDSTKTARLLKFVFNESQSYALEFGDQYMRPYRLGAQLTENGLAITGATQANPVVLTIVGHGYSMGDEIYIGGVEGMTNIDGRNCRVTVLTADTVSLQLLDGTDLDGTGFGAYTSGGLAYRVYTITTPYLEADLAALQYVQSGDIVTIVHPSYAPCDLARTDHTAWTLTTITFGPGISAPTGVGVTGGAAGSDTKYVVTAAAQDTYEESLASSIVTLSAKAPSAGSPATITWSAVSGAQEYYVYKEINGIYGYVGVAGGLSFSDTGIVADTSQSPPVDRALFNGANDYPSTVTYYQGRQIYANTNNKPEWVWCSRSANFHNFTISSPLQDDDAVTFPFAGRRVNEVRHLVDLGTLVGLTSGGEWVVQGDANGIIAPATPNPRQQGYNGSTELTPIIIGNSIIYLQARGSVVRDLRFDIQSNGYTGRDLTVFSTHLFDGYQILDWDFQQIPNAIVWAIRSDGTMLGLTYLPEQEVWGWHRHDTDGTYESVVSVPEVDEDAVYVIVNRTIGGQTKRYIERMRSRMVTDVAVDAFFVDAGLTYSGVNVSAATMTLSAGTGWTVDDTVTLTCSDTFFTAADIGNAIVLRAGTDEVRLTILGYTSGTVVTGNPSKDVPASLQDVATADWDKAVDTIGGLWHLEGKAISVLADGNVVSNGVDEPLYTVTNGQVTLDRPYAIIHAGLPFTADFETLEIENPNGETLSDKRKLINEVTVHVESSRGLFAGPDADHLLEWAQRENEAMGEPTQLATGKANVKIQTTWNDGGQVFIRQQDPLPLTILSVIPSGFVGG